MRLLNTKTLQLKEFNGANKPPYAILSHTWGQEEVLFEDIQKGIAESRIAFSKVQGCCRKATDDGFQWVWIDTCCIDKSSSAELSEAISSMFAWYQNSTVCYAYLRDVVHEFQGETQTFKYFEPEDVRYENAGNVEQIDHNLGGYIRSRWFKRGWTLQELIASKVVEFYSAEWILIGTKSTLSKGISRTTGIPNRILRGESLQTCSVAQRMSWASERETTRVEDKAYCLMGLFGVNLPLIYGEGKRPFLRLQLAIIDQEEDYSILAWSLPRDCGDSFMGLLASTPTDFSTKARNNVRLGEQIHPSKLWQCKPLPSWWLNGWTKQFGHFKATHDINQPYCSYLGLRDRNFDTLQSYLPSRAGLTTEGQLPGCISIKVPREPIQFTSRGLRVFLPVRASANPEIPSIAWIYCLYQGRLLCILLQQINPSQYYVRHSSQYLITVNANFLKEFNMKEVYGYTSGLFTPTDGLSGSLHPFQSGLKDLGKLMDESSIPESGLAKIRYTISELRYIDPSNVSIQRRVQTRWHDHVKIWLEDQTKGPWEWSPLSPPRRPCTKNLWHIEWKCVRTIEILTYF